MGQRLWGRAFNGRIGGYGGRDVPQTAQDIWAWLVELLPAPARPYAGFIAALVGVISGVAAVANPLIDLVCKISGKPKLSDTDIERIVDRLTPKGESAPATLSPDRREDAVKALKAMVAGTPSEREAVVAFANGEIEKGFALLADHVTKAAGQAMPELERLAVLAYASASNSAIFAFQWAAASMGAAANRMAQEFLTSVQERRRIADAGHAPATPLRG